MDRRIPSPERRWSRDITPWSPHGTSRGTRLLHGAHGDRLSVSGPRQRSGQQAERRSGEAEEDQGSPRAAALLGVRPVCVRRLSRRCRSNAHVFSPPVCVCVVNTPRPPGAAVAPWACPRRSKRRFPLFNKKLKIHSCRFIVLNFLNQNDFTPNGILLFNYTNGKYCILNIQIFNKLNRQLMK